MVRRNPLVRLVFLTGVSGGLLISSLGGAWAQSTRNLQEQLYQAIGNQNWGQAVRIVDLMIQANPQQAQELRQYRQQLQQMQQSPTRPRIVAPPPPSTPIQPGLLGVVQIQRRQNGIPVIQARFNRRVEFEMMVDSGASMTLITRQIAAALGISAANVIDNATFNTANGQVKLPIVYVGSIEVGGLEIRQIPVAIGGADMTVGLLGQDFLQRFDVSLRRDQIEFHLRQ